MTPVPCHRFPTSQWILYTIGYGVPLELFEHEKKCKRGRPFFAHSPPYKQKIAHLEGKICQYFGKPTKKVEWRLSGKQNFEWWKKGILSSKKVQNGNPVENIWTQIKWEVKLPTPNLMPIMALYLKCSGGRRTVQWEAEAFQLPRVII